jgi:hypothetical protein
MSLYVGIFPALRDVRRNWRNAPAQDCECVAAAKSSRPVSLSSFNAIYTYNNSRKGISPAEQAANVQKILALLHARHIKTIAAARYFHGRARVVFRGRRYFSMRS